MYSIAGKKHLKHDNMVRVGLMVHEGGPEPEGQMLFKAERIYETGGF